MIKRTLLLSLFFVAIHSSLYADNLFELSISGKRYEQLQLRILLDSKVFSYAQIEGVRRDENTWVFHVPDSAYERHVNMTLKVPTQNSNLVHELSFFCLLNNDTVH